jgi:hypothetical protein
MFDQYIKIQKDKIGGIPWNDDPEEYDRILRSLEDITKPILVLNPDIEDEYLIYWIDEIPDTDKCISFFIEDNWVAKLFPPHWKPHWNAYLEIEIVKPNYVWTKNSDLDKLMTFIDDPLDNYDHLPWDKDYELVWYLDPRVNPTNDKIWALKCRPSGRKIKGIKDMGYVMPDIKVEFNSEIPKFNLDINKHYLPYWELHYEHVLKLDPKYQYNEQLWAVKYTPNYRVAKGWRWIEVIEPDFKIEYNPLLGELYYDLNYTIPWHDFDYEHVWMLDPKHCKNAVEPVWAFKISATDNPKGTKIVGNISPNYLIEYNPELGELDYDVTYEIQHHDFEYEHVWMLDQKNCKNAVEPLWAFKIYGTSNLKGTKIINSISPVHYREINQEIKVSIVDPTENYNIQYHDFDYEHVWYIEDLGEKIWVAKTYVRQTDKEKEMDILECTFPNRLDVIFISYNEPNAEKNWRRVLAKAPWAKRVNGVKGIFEAHKAAAKIAVTDMFYVVDGDAWLVDDWEFDFQPELFDRDCAYVWSSKNPINDLIYQNGGVKLFPKNAIMKKKQWKTLDMFTGVLSKIKAEDRISCVTQFNVDEFSAWRSAFRECVKLYVTNQMAKLHSWTTKGKNKKFGKYAQDGAKYAEVFAKENADKKDILLKINDFDWLKSLFESRIIK